MLQNRLRDSTWTIVFKSLIVVHFMIREGEPNVTLRHLSSNPARKLAINNFTEGADRLDIYLHKREAKRETTSKFYGELKNGWDHLSIYLLHEVRGLSCEDER